MVGHRLTMSEGKAAVREVPEYRYMKSGEMVIDSIGLQTEIGPNAGDITLPDGGRRHPRSPPGVGHTSRCSSGRHISGLI